MRFKSYRRRLMAGLALPAMMFALSAAPAAADPSPVVFNIEAGTLDAALMAYASQTHLQLLYSPDLVAGRRAGAVQASLTPEQALERLLEGSGLKAHQTRPGVIVLKAARRTDEAPAVKQDPAADVGGAQGEPPGAAGEAPAADLAAPSLATREAATELQTLIVTGTHIRGAGETASPVVVLDRDALDASGYGTVVEALSALPQNLGGAGTPDGLLSLSDGLGTNSAASSSINLRGLGADATLVLVNGRRMAGTGLKGDFADVSAIPTAAVERVDVLLDGASALYGSDAVGGVVNVILKRDFEGMEVRARGGLASGGTAQELQVADTLGKVWDRGHVLASYEYYRRDALAAAERSFTASDDLRPLGGTDHRNFYGLPGNVLVFDTASSSYKPAYAIRPNPSGPPGFEAGAVNLHSLRQGMDILPEQTRHSAYLAFGQDLTDRLSLSLDARFSRREFAFASAAGFSAIAISPANPWFASPNGAASQVIGYSFAEELGPVRGSGASDNLGASAGLGLDWGRTWRGEAYVAFAQEKGISRTEKMLQSTYLSEALGTSADNPATGFSTARDGFFNPYGDGSANSRAILDFIGSGWSRSYGLSRVETLNAQADGTLFALAGGEVKMALGANVRRETFTRQTTNFTSGVTPAIGAERSYARQVGALFAELRAPLVGPANARPGLRRLELSLAGRVEDYDDVGRTANPKAGLIYEPLAGVRLRATYGTSFRAPSLPEVFEAHNVGATFLPNGAVRTLSLIQYGGNADLDPETAKSWTAGIDLALPDLPGLRLSATWFRTIFSDRISQPARENLTTVMTDPSLAAFVYRVDPASAADLARVTALINDPTFPYKGMFPASAYGAIVDARYVNTARMTVEGLDATADYGRDLGPGRLDLSASASWVFDFERQVTQLGQAVDLVDLAGNPASFRARASAAWRQGPIRASLSVNRLGEMHDRDDRRIKPWTTFDAQLRWHGPAQGPLADASATLSVQNLFDADPPFYDSAQGVGYDAANADPLGRVVALQLTKRW